MLPHGLSETELRRRYAYDPETGALTWKLSFWGSNKRAPKHAGDPAGKWKGQEYLITMNGYDLPGRRVAWFLMTGEWPTERVRTRDGVARNLAWSNLALASTLTSERIERQAVTAAETRRRARELLALDRRCVDCGAEVIVGRVCPDCRKLRQRWSRIAKRYGMLPEAFLRLLSAQDYACAICGGSPEDGPKVDHDHSTGGVRGILCGPCNTGLGHFRDDTVRLERAAEYLRRHAQPT